MKTMQRTFPIPALLLALAATLAAAPMVLADGEIAGVVLGVVNTEDPCGLGGTIARLEGNSIDLLADGVVVASAVTTATGYRFQGLSEGSYQLLATAPGGESTLVDLDVADGTSVTMNFVVDSASDQGILPSWGGLLVAPGDPNPDVNGNGVVDLEDLNMVIANLEAPPTDELNAVGDELPGEQPIELPDPQTVRDAFGRSVLLTPALYVAEVTAGGSQATIGDGMITVSSVDGETTGYLATTNDPAVARFEIIADQGTATSPELGDFEFAENPADPSWIHFELDTGLILDGRMTLRLDGGPFADTYFVDSMIPDGIITIAPGGFESYLMPNVNGVLTDFAVVGTVAFAMCKDEKKKDKECETIEMPQGSTLCNLGGTACADNATCVKNGKSGICRTKIRGVLRNGKWLNQCMGCVCASF